MNTSTCLQQKLNQPYTATNCSFPNCPIVRQRDSVIERLNTEIEQLQREKVQLAEDYDRLKALLNKRNSSLFGRSSEKSPEPTNDQKTNDHDSVNNSVPAPDKKRGARFGHKGHGRKIPDLPEVEVIHEIPDDQMYCPICGKPRRITTLDEVSYEIDYETRFVCKKHVRKKAFSTCNCPGPRAVTAGKPPQVIPKGKFSNAFLAHILIMKFFFQIPLHRMVTIMRMQGLAISEGALTGMLQKLEPLLYPLYLLLAEINRSESQWHVDETGWMNFVQASGKQGWHWWLWVFVSPMTVVFVLDQSRSSDVPRKHFGEDARGIVSCDRFSAYGKLAALIEGLVRALCWSHFRRDFVDAGKSLNALKAWAELWVSRISAIYRLNDERLAVLDKPELFAAANEQLESALESMLNSISAELADPSLHWQQRKILHSALKHWDGLTVFVDNPYVPMDNNLAERMLRPAALGRKNYYGTHSVWSGNLLAYSMSVLQTAAKHDLDVEAYLRYYLDACAGCNGAPPHLERYLPWNIPEEIIRKYGMRTGGKHHAATG
ncbi:Transposase IS66 family protein [Pelotomaculum schinkii]|uniref:Transposase IS66 family protein n=1 Tax=Pelotomaculum schinkii TaxID=78350 RepID=A0A4Y7R6W3_9FIRM|nr:IS66 family transposase [Pelotomaculum schinkii]TEB04045.1 Transposase IS66 family protein [Pelotomaculum schinkii]TEB04684.1 Transposase IS66 family protein [Pelotomaculum schinkii]